MQRGSKAYNGIDKDLFGGMTPSGVLIRDAWVFGLLPETETCAGWTPDQFQVLYDSVHHAWEPYGHLVSQLPSELAERHQRIHGAAIARARELGWSAELSGDD